jgi:alanyl-tRNA synthetase
MQKGSLVNAERLRFDFSHPEPVTIAEIMVIEDQVNAQIRGNKDVVAKIMPIDVAKQAGAMALFGEQYDVDVRVVAMVSEGEKPFSSELCGGTHVLRTGDIGTFAIISESGIAAGIRRIEALTGATASAWLTNNSRQLDHLADIVKTERHQVAEKVQGIIAYNRQLERELEQLQIKLATTQGKELLSNVQEIHGVKVLIAQLQDVEPKALRGTMDTLRSKLGTGIVLLGVSTDDKASIIAGVSRDLIVHVKAVDLIRYTAGQMNGKGGGRADMAQGGGQTHMLPAALDSTMTWLHDALLPNR